MLILTSSFSTVASKLLADGKVVFKNKRVAFIPTASNPYADKFYMERDRKALVDLGCEVFEVDLEGKGKDELANAFDGANIVFVAGGNVIYLAEQMRRSGFTEIAQPLLATRDYIGSSAGTILLGPSVQPFYDGDIGDLSKDFILTDNRGLGLVDYIVVPHTNVPEFETEGKKMREQFGDQFKFVSLKDDEYRIENI